MKASALLAVAASAAVAVAAPPGALITSLPGLAEMPPFKMYSGYITVRPPPANHSLFYWFVTAASNPATAPLVTWFTGGPGCSSLYALMTEHGPLTPNTTDPTQLVANPFSWNAAANMLYVESPGGVGFTIIGDGNYTTGDDAVAVDAAAFVAGFLQQYPEYQGRPYYIAGESYAGHYVPQLASQLVSNPVPGLNFKGWLVGNPSFDGFLDAQNYWPFMARHGFIATTDFAAASVACNGSFVGPLSPLCSDMLSGFRTEFVDLNPYNVYALCQGPPSLDGGCFTWQAAVAEQAAAEHSGLPAPPRRNLAAQLGDGSGSGSQTVVPCMNVTPTVVYLNQPAVRAALHVDPSAHAWDVCSSYVNYTQYASSVRDIYQSLAGKLRIVVYSGDADSCVPWPGTEACVDSLGFEPATTWRRWNTTDATGATQVAGYTRDYATAGGLTYATVKGAGHMVPTYQPRAALDIFTRIVNGLPL